MFTQRLNYRIMNWVAWQAGKGQGGANAFVSHVTLRSLRRGAALPKTRGEGQGGAGRVLAAEEDRAGWNAVQL